MASQHPAVQELDSLLHSLQSLKAPGVNKSKVDATSKLCVDLQNVSVEPLFVDSLIAAFRRSPITHKLGVLYCIDSIMRQWVAAGAAHAGGVRKMTDNMPALMNELLPVAPDNQKEKLSKLFDIWINTKTFPTQMLADFKQKLHAPPQPATAVSTTPVSTAPAHLLAAFGAPPPPLPPPQPAQVPQPQPATSGIDANILAALSGLIQPAPPAQVNAPQPPMNFNQTQPAVTYPPPQPQAPAYPQYANNPVPGQSQYNGAAIAQSQVPSNPNPMAALMSNSQDPSSLASQLQVLQSLSQQLGPDGLRTLVAALGIPQQGGPPPPAAPVQSVAPVQQQAPQQYGGNNSYPPQNGNSYGRDDQGYIQRARSRSPDNKRRRFSPPNRRESPTYGTYDPLAASSDSGGRGHDDRGRRGRKGYRNDFRQRTPPPATREYHEDSHMQRNQQPKPIGYDPKLPNGKVKVLSRTLFVGGVKTTDHELKNFFGRFGAVQSCIVNHDKRHAFLKLISHQDAIATKTSVEALPDSEYRSMFERVGWAVGFGPTPCADYNVGVSVIPIDLLTEADKKWLLTAEFGGTGGKTVATGMIVEEPDIEIGAGPSSKAIHRRGGGGGGGAGRGGNFGGRRGGNYDNASRYRKPDRPEPPLHPEPNTIGPPPPVPTFGAPIPGFSMNFR